jgi:uroporphyrinogen decarboxylase
MRKPDFERNFLKVMRKEKPDRPTLFELFLNGDLYTHLAGHGQEEEGDTGYLRLVVDGMAAGGYDYASTQASGFHFPKQRRISAKTISLNGQAVITDWESFEKYEWMDPKAYDYSRLEKIRPWLQEGMKLMVYGPDGVLENVIGLVGYDNLCIMLYEEPELVKAIFDRVGESLVQYYEIAAQADTVGFLCSNDDWGFNTQTFLSPADMRKYVFPWHKKIAEAAHRNNKPCILHSCGYFGEIIEDVIEDMGFDGRHSYEDNIMPVEEAYEKYHHRIAVMGGIDVDFLTTRTPEEVYARAKAMVERTADRGGYVLGSGNSIPYYIPLENYLAMTRAAME